MACAFLPTFPSSLKTTPNEGMVNIEFKARTQSHDRHRAVLEEEGARFVGTDESVDTYFACPNGRLKLREGPIETALIFYQRPDEAAVKRSDVALYDPSDAAALKSVLTQAYGVAAVVEKVREIYFVGNVKIHLDELPELGLFIEVEAIDDDGTRPVEELETRCRYFLERFSVQPGDLEARSYADLVSRRR